MFHRRPVRGESRRRRIRNRRRRRLYRRLGRSEHWSMGDGEMELRGPMKLLRLIKFAETARHVAEWRVGRKRLRVDRFLRFFSSRRSRRTFLRLRLRAILRRENLSAL